MTESRKSCPPSAPALVVQLRAEPGASIRRGSYAIPDDAGSWAGVLASDFDGGPVLGHAGRGSVRIIEVSGHRVRANFDLELADPWDGGDEGHLFGTFEADPTFDPGSCKVLIP